MFSIIFLVFVPAWTAAFQITSDTKPDEFPVQIPNFLSDKTFYRITNRTKIELTCPMGYIFDRDENHCVKKYEVIDTGTDGKCLRSQLTNGNHYNPDNCQTFYSCNDLCCYMMYCPDSLLFDLRNNRCLRPRETQCCEYEEKNSARLII